MAIFKKNLLKISNVFIHDNTPEDNKDNKIAGSLNIWNKNEGKFVEWIQDNDSINDIPHSTSDWTIINDTNINASLKKKIKHKYIINFNLHDLKCFRKIDITTKKSKSNFEIPYLIFTLKCGTTFPALHFHTGGLESVILELHKFLSIFISSQDKNLYLIKEQDDQQALSKSFSELNVFGKEQAGDVLSNFFSNPYSATLGGFSKVTKFIQDIPSSLDSFSNFESTLDMNDLNVTMDNAVDFSELVVKTDNESGFAVVTNKIRQTSLPERMNVNRIAPISAQLWSSYMDNDGRLRDVQRAKEDIFRGGVDPTIRQEVWKFLLGYYKWDSTYKSRVDERKQKIDDYFRMKMQWKNFNEDQQSRFSDLRDRKNLIEKDVLRTDRTHNFFQGPDNPNISILFDILITHCMYDFDLGYVQGMSDLLAPILVVMEHEVDAFWCFAGFIKILGKNFEKDQKSMKTQLQQLQILLTFLDPELADYLDTHESLNMYFCFRWLLIVFKREFNFPDIMRLWEVILTGLPCKNFHLLICLAILDTAKSTLIENNFGFTEILKYINDLSGNLNVEDILKIAEGMIIQMRDCKDLPSEVYNILGLSIKLDENSLFKPYDSLSENKENEKTALIVNTENVSTLNKSLSNTFTNNTNVLSNSFEDYSIDD